MKKTNTKAKSALKEGIFSLSKYALLFICSILILAVVISVLLLLLPNIYFFTQKTAAALGYSFIFPDLVIAAICTVSGACVVALIALFGVHRQNISAEIRHYSEQNLELRKEIILETMVSFAKQYETLMSYAHSEVDDANRKKMVKGTTHSFFKLQTVCSVDTIKVMIEANEIFGTALMSMMLAQKVSKDPLFLLNASIKCAMPYLEKIVEFNVCCRNELNCNFENDEEYISFMNDSFSKMNTKYQNLRQFVNEQSENLHELSVATSLNDQPQVS